MLAWLASNFMAWLGGRGLRTLVREIADALEKAEIERDYKLAIQENAALEAKANQSAQEAKAQERMNHADTGPGAADVDNAAWLREFSRVHRNR